MHRETEADVHVLYTC